MFFSNFLTAHSLSKQKNDDNICFVDYSRPFHPYPLCYRVRLPGPRTEPNRTSHGNPWVRNELCYFRWILWITETRGNARTVGRATFQGDELSESKRRAGTPRFQKDCQDTAWQVTWERESLSLCKQALYCFERHLPVLFQLCLERPQQEVVSFSHKSSLSRQDLGLDRSWNKWRTVIPYWIRRPLQRGATRLRGSTLYPTSFSFVVPLYLVWEGAGGTGEALR